MEFRMSTLLIGILMFSLIVGALSIPYAELGQNYNVTIDNSFNATYNKIDTLEKNISLVIGDEVKQESQTNFDSFVLAGKTILQAPKLIFETIGLSARLIASVGRDLGIPVIFLSAFGALLVIAVTFLAISLWARYKA